jgi:hypothetical protein
METEKLHPYQVQDLHTYSKILQHLTESEKEIFFHKIESGCSTLEQREFLLQFAHRVKIE